MRLLFFLILALTASSLSAFATFEPSCEPLLQRAGISRSLASNQLIVVGHLTFDSVKQRWLIYDEHTREVLSPQPSDYLFELMSGDEVFLLDDEGHVKAEGFFHLDSPQPASVNSKKVPLLFSDREMTNPLMTSDEFERAFLNDKKAMAIVSLTPLEKVLREFKYRIWMQKLEKHLENPQRLIKVDDTELETAYFEKVFRGILYYVVTRPTGMHQGPGTSDGETLQFRLKTNEGTIPIQEGDRIILLNQEGKIFYQTRLSRLDLNHSYPSVFLQNSQRATSAVVLVPDNYRDR